MSGCAPNGRGGAGGSARGRFAACEGGIVFKLLAFLAVMFAGAALGWMMLLPFVVKTRIQERTGFGVEIERLMANPFTGKLDVRGLVMTNSPAFPLRDFLDVETLRADLRVWSLFSERMVFDLIEVDIAKAMWVRRKDGAMNADAFREAAIKAKESRQLEAIEGGTEVARGREGAGEGRTRGLLVRTLRVRVRGVVIADHSREPTTVREVELGFDETYAEISDMRSLFARAELRPLGEVARGLAALAPAGLGAAAESGVGAVKQGVRDTSGKVKGLFEMLEENRKP